MKNDNTYVVGQMLDMIILQYIEVYVNEKVYFFEWDIQKEKVHRRKKAEKVQGIYDPVSSQRSDRFNCIAVRTYAALEKLYANLPRKPNNLKSSS